MLVGTLRIETAILNQAKFYFCSMEITVKKKADTKGGIQPVNGKSIEDWDKEWMLVPNGFRILQSQLRGEIGIFAAKEDGKIKYIGSAVQVRNGGLRAGLARARVKKQSGNSSYGMQKVRAHRDTAEAYVIFTRDPHTRVQDAHDLADALISIHRPEWNAPRSIVAAARRAYYNKRR